MNAFEFHHNVSQATALSITSISSNTTTNGNIIDTARFESLEFLLLSGTITDGSYAVTMEHGDDSGLSDGAAVSSDETLGDADFAATDDNTAKRLGYIGKRRYVRLVITSTGVTTGGTIGAVSLLGTPHHAPVAD